MPTTERKNLTRYRKGQVPVTDARDATEASLSKRVEKGEFRVHIVCARQCQETVYVVAPKDFEKAEKIGIANAAKYHGPVERCLVEYLSECAGGCGTQMASYDPRYSKGKGAPTAENVLNQPRWCIRCGTKEFLGTDRDA